MGQTWPLLVLLLLFAYGHIFGESVSVNVGDSAKLTANETCEEGEELTVTTLDNSCTVATLVGGVLTPGPDYKGRIEAHSASSVTLSRVNYNDGGFFEFFCGGRQLSITQLTVLVSHNLSVNEGAPALLPCHAKTVGRRVKMRWERNGTPLFELDQSGRVSHGRGSAALDWYSTGDLSLTLEAVRPEDQGDFNCYIVHEDGRKDRGNPAAVTMRVNKRNPITLPPPPPTPEAPAGNMEAGFIASIILNAVLSLATVFFAVLWLKARRSNGRGRGSRQTPGTAGTARIDETDVETELVAEGGRAGSHLGRA